MWAASISSVKKNLSDARAAASIAGIGRFKDWRVATYSELLEIAKIYPGYLDIMHLKNGEYLTDTKSNDPTTLMPYTLSASTPRTCLILEKGILKTL
jgi:hypothetical protein